MIREIVIIEHLHRNLYLYYFKALDQKFIIRMCGYLIPKPIGIIVRTVKTETERVNERIVFNTFNIASIFTNVLYREEIPPSQRQAMLAVSLTCLIYRITKAN